MGAKIDAESSQDQQYAPSPTSDRSGDTKEYRSQTRAETSQTLSHTDQQLARLSNVQTSLTKAELDHFKRLTKFINSVIKQGKNQQEQDKNLAYFKEGHTRDLKKLMQQYKEKELVYPKQALAEKLSIINF
ncbi:hypothetical protein CQA38_04440 [Campylobacter sp. MIT 12-5580]|nr:hypothetical protein CQA38_04440 [Campylobacter sp. MIT 12-5580]